MSHDAPWTEYFSIRKIKGTKSFEIIDLITKERAVDTTTHHSRYSALEEVNMRLGMPPQRIQREQRRWSS